MRNPILLVSALLAFPATLAGQQAAGWVRLSPRLAPSRSAAAAFAIEPPAPIAPAQYRPTHWKEGAIAGGVIGGILGAALGNGMCGVSDAQNKSCLGSTVLGGLAGALVLAVPGALIGGLFPKGGGNGDRAP